MDERSYYIVVDERLFIARERLRSISNSGKITVAVDLYKNPIDYRARNPCVSRYLTRIS